MTDQKKQLKTVDSDFLWAYIAIGVFVVAMLLRSVWWGEGGFMTDPGAYQRFLTVLGAVVFGFGLGWLVYPRRPKWPFGED